MTLQNAPPGLDRERDKKFSKVWQLLKSQFCGDLISESFEQFFLSKLVG